MSDAKMVGEVARQLLGDFAKGGDNGDPWRPFHEGGWAGVGVPESDGGLGGTMAEAASVAEAVGRTAAPTAAMEAILALIFAGSVQDQGGLLGELSGEDHRVTLSFDLPLAPTRAGGSSAGMEVLGSRLVPFAAECTEIVNVHLDVDGGLRLVVMPREQVDIRPLRSGIGDSMGEILAWDGAGSSTVHLLSMSPESAQAAVALMTAARINGAIRTTFELSLDYVNQRRQFGRSIGSFQAVAHAMAGQVSEVELVAAAFEEALASETVGHARGAVAARALSGRSAGKVARIAHQVHGAIGVTGEHDLHRFTSRLTAWPFTFGTTREWERALSLAVVSAGVGWWEELDPLQVSVA